MSVKRTPVCDLKIIIDELDPTNNNPPDPNAVPSEPGPTAPPPIDTGLDSDIEGAHLFKIGSNDLSLLLEKHHFLEYSHGRSLPSKGVFSVSVPDPVDPKAEFFYNYFVPDERKYLTPDPKNILYDSTQFNDKDIQFVAVTDQTPRYVRLEFKPPKVNDISATQVIDKLNTVEEISVSSADIEDFFMGSFNDLGENVTLEELVNKITIEGAGSNYNFTGTEIIDTFADKKIYTMLTSCITLLNIDSPADSPRERAQLFREKISDGKLTPNPTGMDKLSLIDILSEMQPAGVSLAPGDVDEAVAQTSTDPITKQSFSTKFNNLFMDDILQFNTLTMNTVFEDELRALRTFSGDIQTKAIQTIDPDFTYDHEHQLSVEPIKITPLVITQDQVDTILSGLNSIKEALLQNFSADPPSMYSKLQNPASVYTRFIQAINRGIANPTSFILKTKGVPKVKIIGYMIQKTEVKSDGTTQEFPNIFVDNPLNFSFYVDKEVRYGAVYNYKIRTLSIVSSCVAVVNEDFNSKDYAIADYLMASDGRTISVECVENVPPPAPVRLNAHIDYKYRKPVLTWEFPLNKQRDIKRFQVFKRQKTILEDDTVLSPFEQPFTLVAEYDFDNSIYRTVPNEIAQSDRIYRLTQPFKQYRDAEFNLDFDEAIYAIASVDAHGLSSNYSSQLHLKYDKYTNTLHKNVVCFRESPKPYPNLYIDRDFFKDLITSSGKKRCNVYFDPEYYKLLRKSGNFTIEDIKYLKTSDTDYNYTFQMVNIDLQEEQRIKIRIADKSGREVGVPAAKISPTNLNFEFGKKE